MSEPDHPPRRALLLYGPLHGLTRPADGPVIRVDTLGLGPHAYARTGRTLDDGREVYEYRPGPPPDAPTARTAGTNR